MKRGLRRIAAVSSHTVQWQGHDLRRFVAIATLLSCGESPTCEASGVEVRETLNRDRKVPEDKTAAFVSARRRLDQTQVSRISPLIGASDRQAQEVAVVD